MVTQICINIGSCNGSLPASTSPLPEPMLTWQFRAYSRLAPSQWETSLQSNAVSHWLAASLESALQFHRKWPRSIKLERLSVFYFLNYCHISAASWTSPSSGTDSKKTQGTKFGGNLLSRVPVIDIKSHLFVLRCFDWHQSFIMSSSDEVLCYIKPGRVVFKNTGWPVSHELWKLHWAQCPRKLWRPCRPEDPQKYFNCRSCKSIACLYSRNQYNSHKLFPVQQDLQMLHLPVHPLYCQPGAKDL